MSIHKLPDFVVNRLKAWEVIQRPSSILKELVENSLDAWATEIEISINDGGKSLISVQDNWTGIELSDIDLLLERYATSKINSDEDLYNLNSYWFRWEALASIAEVSKISVLTKTEYAEIGTKLVRRWDENVVRHTWVPFEHWTLITIEDLFYNVPARLKFLKSAQTEFYYCYNYFVDIALYHYDKSFILKKNNKLIFDLKSSRDLEWRVLDLFKKDRWNKIISFSNKEEKMTINWIVSNSSLRFWSPENIKTYVNWRPIQDKIIRKALSDAYLRQLTPWEYPMAIIMLDINPDIVDVNVHPAKLQVKFAESQKVYEFVFKTISETVGENKIGSVSWDFYQQIKWWDWTNWDNYRPTFSTSPSSEKNNYSPFFWQNIWKTWFNKYIWNNTPSQSSLLDFSSQGPQISHFSTFDEEEEKDNFYFNEDIGEYQILWQTRNSYIVLQSDTAIYWIDQHALAERISFEKMKKSQEHEATNLLQPLKFEVTQIPNLEEKINQLNELWFEISKLTENVIAIYSIPKVFVKYPIDIPALLDYVLYLENITFDHILDWIYATKACKTSIKAWYRLSYSQMKQLVQDGFEYIPWMFVCQHWRPFFVKMDKGEIDKLFDRN